MTESVPDGKLFNFFSTTLSISILRQLICLYGGFGLYNYRLTWMLHPQGNSKKAIFRVSTSSLKKVDSRAIHNSFLKDTFLAIRYIMICPSNINYIYLYCVRYHYEDVMIYKYQKRLRGQSGPPIIII